MSESIPVYTTKNGRGIKHRNHKIYFAMVRHALGLIGAIFELVTGDKPPKNS